MGIPAVSSLANMEYALYGGRSGLDMNVPSFTNGYKGSTNNSIFNPYGLYGSYNPSFTGTYNQTGFGQNIPSSYAQQSPQSGQSTNTSFQQGFTQEDVDKLADYYAKNNALEEGLMGAAAGGLSWMAFEHAQSIFHPINAWKGLKSANEIFKNVPKEFAKQNATLLQEANIAVQQTVRDTGSKWWYSKWLRKPLNEADIKPLVEEMRTAVNNGDVEAIAKATERLQGARGMDGRIAGTLTGKKTVAERLTSKSGEIETKAKELVEMNSSVISNNFGSLLKSTFKKDFMGFMVFETLFNAGKIITAFKEDTTTGLKQTGQSLGKSALGTAGWCAGRAAGIWLGAKVGASIGMAGGPVGAGIGALIGFTVGSIGMWAGHKLGNAILGHDVADKVEAKNMARTQEGQTQLLQFAAQKAQEGKTDNQTNQVLYKALSMYA